MHRIVRHLVPALSLLALVLAQGCADHGLPTGVAPDAGVVPVFTMNGSSQHFDQLATFRQRPTVTTAWAMKLIGPSGGRLDFQGFAIEVPAGAVAQPTLFTIALPADASGSERVVAEFGPHNRRFAKPVTIEFPYRGTSIEGSAVPTVVWWNDEWVNMGGSLTRDGSRLKTQTDHFSTYGTTADLAGARGGSLTVSGG